MKLWIMRGLPASGKSTRAEEIVRTSGNTVRVNKDLLRMMLHFDRWSGRNEGATHAAARALAFEMLRTRNVVIDDTNLNPGVLQSWKELARAANADQAMPDVQAEVIDMTGVDAEECVRRDAQREKRVGKTVVRGTALRYGLHRFEPNSVVLCDLDGTLCDIEHRLPHLRCAPKDWKAFFGAIPQDVVRVGTRALLHAHVEHGRIIVFVSARPDTYRDETETWLAAHVGLPYYALFMRRGGDRRDDEIVKAEILDTYFQDRSAIHAVIDDRPRVIRMWRVRGLNVIDVGAGVEF